MNWLKLGKAWALNLVMQHYGKFLGVAALICSGEFFSNLLLDLSDGSISDAEFHSLLSMASGSQMVFLTIVMAVLKLRK